MVLTFDVYGLRGGFGEAHVGNFSVLGTFCVMYTHGQIANILAIGGVV